MSSSSTNDPQATKPTESAVEELRVVVDANITLAIFLVRRDRPAEVSSKRILLDLLLSPQFRWLWTPEIIADYERGAQAVENDARIRRKATFDRAGFELFLSALQLQSPVTVSATTLRAARRRMSQATKARDLDLDDTVYLACAVDGNAQLLTSEDSDLLNLGDVYEDVRIMRWRTFVAELQRRRLIR